MEKDKGHREESIRRFGTGRIVEHAMAIILFLVLVVTGLSQKFHGLEVSRWFISQAGGIFNVRLIHRISGVGFFSLTFLHVIINAFGILVRRWQPSMMINRNDFVNAVHNIKYYIGMERSPARCDRYSYKQKFEYWGILTGALLMGLSGLLLWFPTVATRFLPGEVIPAAKALHTNEALVILLLIAIWHIYNAIFSPDVFPLDTSIFTGFISRKRMLRDHPIELDRIDTACGVSSGGGTSGGRRPGVEDERDPHSIEQNEYFLN